MIIDITRINKSNVLINSCIPDTDLCKGLQGELKAIVTAICGLPNFEQLADCELELNSATTQNDLNLKLKDYLCQLKVVQNSLVNIIDTEYDVCNGDQWDNGSNICLEDSPVGLTETLQSTIRRVITLTVYITQILDMIETINNKINNVETEITKIKNNCCNVTLVNRIADLEQRLLNANIP